MNTQTRCGTAAIVILMDMNSATTTVTSVASVIVLKIVSSVEELHAAYTTLLIVLTNLLKSGGLNLYVLIVTILHK